MLIYNNLTKYQYTMKYIFEAILFAHFVAALAKSSVKPMENDNNMKKATQSDMINNYYAGPNCKNIEQQLAEIKQDTGALKENQTCGSVGNGLSPEVTQQLAEIKQGIRALNTTGSGGNGLSSEVKQQLAEITQGIKELKENQTSGSVGNDLLSEVKKQTQQLAEIKQEINELKENHTSSGSGGDGLFFEVKQQLAEIKQEIRALNGNQTGCSAAKVPKNCAEVYQSGNKISGVYKIDPDGLGEFEVFCDQKTAGGGWTVFQKRHDGSVDFFRGWNDYKQGFGNLSGEFWLGLDKIHRLTEINSSNKLRVDLEEGSGRKVFAEYSSFSLENETGKYKLTLGNYSGSAVQALGYHRGMSFSTKDRDNDKSTSNCASGYKGAWWYNNCYHSNLNGLYLPGSGRTDGNRWYDKGMKSSEMKIRPKGF